MSVCLYVCMYVWMDACMYVCMYLCISVQVPPRKYSIVEGCLEVKLPTIWTDGTAEVGRVREKKSRRERRSEKRKSQKKEDAGARKGRKVAKHCVFPMICGSGGSKSRLAKAAGAEEMKSCTPLWREANLGSPNVQNTPTSYHFWKLRCRKSARRCGAKHISKSKCVKHTSFGPLLEVEMSKKVYALVARSTFPSQNVENTTCFDHF